MPLNNIDFVNSLQGQSMLQNAGVNPSVFGGSSNQEASLIDPMSGKTPNQLMMDVESIPQQSGPLNPRLEGVIQQNPYVQQLGKVAQGDLSGPIPQDLRAKNQEDVITGVRPVSTSLEMPSSPNFYTRHGADIVKGMTQMEQGLRQEQAAGAQQAARDIGYREALATKQQEAMDRINQLASDYTPFEQKEVQKLQEIRDRMLSIEPLSKKEAINKYFSDLSVPGKILAGIGFTLAIAATATKSPIGQVGLSMFNSLFEGEIQKQRAQIANLSQAEAAQKNILGIMQSQFGDRVSAELKTLSLMNDYTANQLQKSSDMARSPDLKGKIDSQIGQLRQRSSELLQQAEMRDFNRWITERTSMKGKELKPLSGEVAGRFALSLSGLEDIQKIGDRLGGLEFEYIGDTEFEQARKALEESLGRLSSGGAIREDEYKSFRKMIVPNPKDSPKEAKSKIERGLRILSGHVIAQDPSGKLRQVISESRKMSTQEIISGQPILDLGFKPQ